MSIFGFIEDVTGITASREQQRRRDTIAQEQRDEIQRRLDAGAHQSNQAQPLRRRRAGAAMLSALFPAPRSLLRPRRRRSAPPQVPPGGLNARPTPARTSIAPLAGPMMADATASQILTRLSQLQARRSSFEEQWNSIDEYVAGARASAARLQLARNAD